MSQIETIDLFSQIINLNLSPNYPTESDGHKWIYTHDNTYTSRKCTDCGYEEWASPGSLEFIEIPF